MGRFSALSCVICCLDDGEVTPDSVRGERGLSWPKMGSHRVAVVGIFTDEQDRLAAGEGREASGDSNPRLGWSGDKAPHSGSESLVSAV